ncbi:MAG: LysR family transcriptional regulator [Paracoccus sp. (in: a-proteobacteria)]|uniref:LysR family transcriptional regulator n=1 Tax=unclassified Paracoccus (in: a-proteobacteria) TaxID=2688777 RepID=UPI0017F9326C|nr:MULTISPECIES: LysR family transcriptional regulator [unclassified Paracoccus (in: a-proteobacteria)]MCS5601050.1 LysR family transcriptional regulator [Paracoccus sp. (in: a-proteobacteria)]HIC66570.1 LysR family transcriptional regulator [Paracoccus sp. (in: a-proteobacteria)]
MNIGSWDDIRIALAVARSGTVSGAAEALGVHHATVIRRIDALEAQLGTRLFQRHPRGYALTEPGQALLQVARDTDERFAQLAAQIGGAGDRIEGELVVTSLPGLSDLVMPRLIGLLRRHPGLRLNYVTDVRLFRLAAGEAHVAIRAGTRPTEPDYVVRRMTDLPQSLYATAGYLKDHGDPADLARQRLALPGPEARNAPLMRWLAARTPPDAVVMTANDTAAREAVIRAGLAMGPLPPARAAGLVEALSLPEWSSALWLVTHVDLHRTPKVQAAVAALRGD